MTKLRPTPNVILTYNVCFCNSQITSKTSCDRFTRHSSHINNMAPVVISEEEVQQLTLDLADVETGLSAHMSKFGVAIVKNVAGVPELGELQRFLSADLKNLVVTPATATNTASPHGKCQGVTAAGAPCKIALGQNMGMAYKHTRPLRLGGSFCSLQALLI